MRNILKFTIIAILSSSLSLATTSCSPKVGCPANEAAHVKPGKNGELPTSRGNTKLFPKDFNKKKKRRKRN